ncbi:putative signal peptide-containing protein [Cryptosporidium parvum]
MFELKFLFLFLALALLRNAAGDEFSDYSIFQSPESSTELSGGSLGMLNFGQKQSLEDTTFDTQSQVLLDHFQDPNEPSTIGNMISENNYPVERKEIIGSFDDKYKESPYSETSMSSRRGKRSQNIFSINKILSKYSKEELALLNEYLISFSMLLKRRFRKFIFKKYSPSRIRSQFAKMYVDKFGGSKSKALLKLREFEKILSLKHSAARRLFHSQFNLLISTLNSAEALIYLTEKWRYQPTYISEPLLVVSKSSYNKLMNLCKKKSRKIKIVLVSASSELIPKKFRKSDLNDSFQELSKFSKTIHSFQESASSGGADSKLSLGTTQCNWDSSRKKKAKFTKSSLKCFFKPKKRSFFHIHYYDITNTAKFKYLMQVLLRYKPNPYSQNAYPLIIIPVLIGIPQIDKNGSILGLNSITEVTKKKRKYGKSFNHRNKKKSNKKKRTKLGK